MGRPKCFNREEVLEKTIPVFWKAGFADTSLQDIEKATGVNRSGLYSEFKDKDDLYVECLKQYVDRNGGNKILSRLPLGWDNIRALLVTNKVGTPHSQRGCFVVNSIRELSVLPPKARSVVTDHLANVRKLVLDNVRTALPSANAESVAEMILTFNAGLCLEQNMAKDSPADKIEAFISMLRRL